MVLVLLSLIEVSPIKINPWSRLAKIIGHALNAEVLEQQKQTQKKLEEHIQVDDERNANLLRTQILRFNDELIDDKHHTREHFIEILAVIDAYEDYCRSHPDYKNNRCICAVANIKRVWLRSRITREKPQSARKAAFSGEALKVCVEACSSTPSSSISR